LFMTVGAQNIPAIAALSVEVSSALMITGFASLSAGAVGLATSYFSPRLFKNIEETDSIVSSSDLSYV
jgi:hypothetical protein